MMTKTLAAAFVGALALTALGSANAAEYAVDPTHTNIIWEAPHFGTSTNRGRFDKKSGSVMFDRAAKTGKVELTIDLASLNTGVPALDKHMLGEDFFDAAKHPNAVFKGDKFTFSGDKVTEVAGQLTLRGKTHPLTLKAIRFNCYDNPFMKREVCGGDFEATIKRSLFGVNWGLNMGVPDDTKVVIQVEAVKQ
jgi:polyisoprenoid-binding protein YceI